MAFSEATYNRIQRYLAEQLDSKERQAFEEEMRADEALAQEVELHQEMKAFLADTPENEFRRNLQILREHEDVSGKGSKASAGWKLWWLFPLFLLAGWWWWAEHPFITQTETIEPREEAGAVPDGHVEEMPASPEVEISPQSGEEVGVPSSGSSRRPGVMRADEDPSENAEQTTKEGPIAAHFDPLPALEFLIDNNLRNDDFQWVNTSSPQEVSVPPSEATFLFRFSGTLTSETNLSEKEFRLHLFTNKAEAFDAFDPLSSFPLQFTTSEVGTYAATFQASLSLPQGLYYYLIEEVDTERIYLVNRFLVK